MNVQINASDNLYNLYNMLQNDQKTQQINYWNELYTTGGPYRNRIISPFYKNQINKLPDIMNCPNLIIVNFIDNKIVELPEYIINWKQLKKFHICIDDTIISRKLINFWEKINCYGIYTKKF